MCPRRSGGGWAGVGRLGLDGRKGGGVWPRSLFFQHKEVTSDGSQSFLIEVFERTRQSSPTPPLSNSLFFPQLGSRDRDSHSLPMSPGWVQVSEEDARFVDGRVATRPGCWERSWTLLPSR